MQHLYDAEFGEVSIKTVSSSRHVRLRVEPTGRLSATIPSGSAVAMLQKLINDSRSELRPLVEKALLTQPKLYEHNQKIGASHTLHFIPDEITSPKGRITGTIINIRHPLGADTESDEIQNITKRFVKKALGAQAEHYLPRRLRQLATDHNFSYRDTGFGNAKGRWGSCSSSGMIRLNIALMKLPLGLIDYVLIHELAHTKELNHSSKFWSLVEAAYPHYKSARAQLKNFSPYI